MSDKLEKDVARYRTAAHAMQSGVAVEMNTPGLDTATKPKHLRVGINVALCDHAGLVGLLIKKGIITEEEYAEAIADEMEREKARHEEELSQHLGKPVTLA